MASGLTKAFGALRQLSVMGLPPAVVFGPLIDCLKDIVPFETANIVLLNADYSGRDALANAELPITASQRYTARWFNREETALYPSHMRLQNDRSLQVVRVSDFTPRMAETELYEEVLGHWEHHWIAGVSCRDGTRPIGNLGLGRPAGAKDFTSDELRLLSQARPYLAQALSADEAFQAGPRATEVERGMLSADLDGRILWTSPNAWRLLRWARGVPLTEQFWTNLVYEWARPLLSELGRRVHAAVQAIPTPPAVLYLTNGYGEFVIRGFALNPTLQDMAAGVGIQVERRLPEAVVLFRSPIFRRLSGQERKVAQGLIAGSTQREIAVALGLSGGTIMSHTRNMYARLGLHTRQELAALLLGEPGTVGLA